MKKMHNNMWRSVVALILVFTMVLGASSNAIVALADTVKKEELNYVSLGDSMTNGYGLTNYDNNGFNTYGDQAYPNQFADWLVDNGYADKVNHSQYALSAMRAEDLHFILEFPIDDANAMSVADGTYNEDAWNAAFSVGDYYTWDEFCNNGRFYQNISKTNSTNEAAKAYQKAVAEADIISVGVGNANFGVFLMGRMTNAIGFGGDASEDAWIQVERALAECDAETKAQVLELKAKIDTLLAEKLSAMKDSEALAALVTPLVNAISYTVISYVLNYAGVLERIMELNPDAEVILVGIMNTLAGVDFAIEVEGNETIIPLADLFNVIEEPINTYIAALPTMMQEAGNEMYANGTFYYAEAPEVECMVSTYEDALKNADSVVRSRFVEEIIGICDCTDDTEKQCKESTTCPNWDEGMVWGMVAPLFAGIPQLGEVGLSLDKINLNDIVAYEEGKLNELDPSEIFSCAIYLAFEEAIVIGSKDSTLPASSLLSLANKFEGVFDGVGANLMGSLDFDAVMTEVTVKVTEAGTAEVTAWAAKEDNQKKIENLVNLTEGAISGESAAMAAFALDNEFVEMINLADTEAKLTEYFTYKYAPYYAAVVLGEDITPALTTALTSDATLMGLLHLFGRMLIGNGLGAHPSAAGHDELSKAVITSYANKYTTKEETIKNLKETAEILAGLVAEYYDESYAYAYAEADKAGYIDDAVEALEDVKNLLPGAEELALLKLSNKMKAELVSAVNNAENTIDAFIKLVKEADLLDQATLDAAMELLGALGQNMTDIREILTQAGVEAGQAVWDAYEKAVEIYETQVRPVIIEKLTEAFELGTQWLMNKVQEAYEAFVDAAVAAVKKYVPMIDEYLYDWIYNNPDKVIAFFNEYGDDMAAFFAEYGDEFLAVIGYIGYTYGEEILAYVLENPEEILTSMVQWYEKYGERTWEMIDRYAEYLGLYDYLDSVKEELKEALEKEYAKAEEAVKAEIEKAIAAIEKELETIKNQLAELKAMIDKALEEGKEDMDAALEALEEEILKQLADLKVQAEKLIDTIKEILEEAVSAEYLPTSSSYYVSIGDSSVTGYGKETVTPFGNRLAAELGLKDTQFKQLGLDGATTTDLFAVVEANKAEIEKADLITVGLSANAMLDDAFQKALDAYRNHTVYEYDWDKYVKEEGTAFVKEKLAEVEAMITEKGLGTFSVPVLTLVESLAYNFVEFAFTYPELINNIHAINGDAQVVIVGMHNPMKGIKVEGLDLGEYVDYLIKFANIHFTVYSFITPNTVYVDAPEVDVYAEEREYTAFEFLTALMRKNLIKDFYATADGHEYIKDQIFDRLDIIGLLGDANRDGIVNILDAVLVLKYSVGVIDETKLNVKVCDVDGNEAVDLLDAIYILKYGVGVIAQFPVEA